MSNDLAIATVTASLAKMLTYEINGRVEDLDVLIGPPTSETPDNPTVRICLYRVEPNPAWGSCDLPTRSESGELLERPQVALTLNYLLMFDGKELTYEPQRMMGSVVRALHERPLLSRDDIRTMVGDPLHPLSASDLADQPERVRFTPLSLSLDELSKLWSVFFQTRYRLSIAYSASVVLISPDVHPMPSRPVRERHIHSALLRRPFIERIESQSDDPGAAIAGESIRIVGNQLLGEATVVAVGGQRITPPPPQLGDNKISIDVPMDLRIGVMGLHIEHSVRLGDPAERDVTVAHSNTVPLLIRPMIVDVGNTLPWAASDVTTDAAGGRSGRFDLTIVPPIAKEQQALLELHQADPHAGESLVYSFADQSRDEAPAQTSQISFKFAGVAAGSYSVRIVVDGVESRLDRDRESTSPTFGMLTGPQASIP